MLQRYVFATFKPISQDGVTQSEVVAQLSRRYLWVYGLAMGSDWLQGPYIYSVYKEQHDLPERLVALLFVLGFLTAGISAPAVGVWADQYGRKRMCMVFCVTYAIACGIIQITSLPLLFVGRFLGGFSTAILFSCFESWLVSSANTLSISSHDLSTIFGHATLVNSIAATVAGIASNKLVEYSALLSSPFLASGALLLLTLVVISITWQENYGGTGVSAGSILNIQHLSQAWAVACADKRLFVLGFIQMCFEGSMYLFVFLWVPFLQEAASPNHALPLGYIFSSFMLSMTFGALLYGAVVSLNEPSPMADVSSSSHDDERTVAFHAKLSSAVCAVGAFAFIISTATRHERLRFWAFCAYEACVGVYYPVQGMLRGKLVPDEHRATLFSLFRVPLNVFVVVSLMTGVASARHFVLSACSLLLLLSALVTAFVFLGSTRGPALASLRVE
ncbi:DUF791-domain-containing protein [Trametes versicolor FP-101664 SS1]|uniref:DUF791-domain-containing protein n=1 Tax=Trametes versicolor (strain FP-101664) TaxID=717944 RepID=UPI0004623E96|nr:DUF791-domain-containing protein [Trametes versicolor FP-101664 SS1]EIW54809.1 DUF791-domain-containing protein [Trametes versicolor FP-101664 SS1]